MENSAYTRVLEGKISQQHLQHEEGLYGVYDCSTSVYQGVSYNNGRTTPRLRISNAGGFTSGFQSPWLFPPQSEIYRALHELVQQGILYRTKQLKGNDPKVDFQEIVLYHFTSDGEEKAKLYKKQVKTDLDRCLGILNKAVVDNY